MSDTPETPASGEDVAPTSGPDERPGAAYRGRYECTHTALEAKESAEGTAVRTAGRLVLWRPMGGLAFGTIQDRSGRVQISIRKDDLGPEAFKAACAAVRVGDFVGVDGAMWVTNKGENTVGGTEFVLLAPNRRPMPDKWAGISDVEARYRKRYLDLLYNEESRDRFITRSKVIAFIRRYLDDNGFMEVETPILIPAASGAAARPFVTHHNALDTDFFLRISPETYLKRLTAGGIERVYEIGRNFRNEGVDASHLQEFTMLEWYAAYWDYTDNMDFVEALIRQLVIEVTGGTTIEREGVTLDFGPAFPRIDYRQAVLDGCGVDLRTARDLESLRAEIKRVGIEIDTDVPSYAALVDQLYKKTVRPTLTQPCFLLHHPAELVPLARRNDDDPAVLDMFQFVVFGWEVVKAYSELVDPVEQRARLEEQMAMREAGDDETMMLEEDFIEAMEYGMPPQSGLGLGIDRFVALLTDAHTLRDVVFFPQMRDGRGSSNVEATDADADAE
jgi:lysyl-tRNA synthetase class 2